MINGEFDNTDDGKSYVYQYLRSRSSQYGPIGSPYYIGKGRGRRAYRKEKSEIQPPKDKANIVILFDSLIDSEALRIEEELIRKYGRIDLGTGFLRNRTFGGEGNFGAIRTKEHRAKIGAVHKGLRHTEESKTRMSKSRTGLKRSEETKARMSAWQKGKKKGPMSEEQKAKISSTTKGKPKSEEFKAKIREANRKRRLSDETKAKIACSLKGKRRSEESKKKQSASNMGRPSRNKGKEHSAATKAKMSIAQTMRWKERHEFNEMPNIDVERQLRANEDHHCSSRIIFDN